MGEEERKIGKGEGKRRIRRRMKKKRERGGGEEKWVG